MSTGNLSGSAIPAGWYNDPSNPQTSVRYWNGTSWTQHSQPIPHSPLTAGPPEIALVTNDAGGNSEATGVTEEHSNLHPCPDCGTGLSPLAQVCVRCGRPMATGAVVFGSRPSSTFAPSSVYGQRLDAPQSVSPFNNSAPKQSAAGFGIASLVLSLLFLGGLGSLLGVILGIVGIRRANAQGTSEGKGMATAGVVIGVFGLVGAATLILLQFLFLFTGAGGTSQASGPDGVVAADLRRAAIAEETYFTEYGIYTSSDNDLGQLGFSGSGSEYYSFGGGVTAVTSNAMDTYCLQATSVTGKTLSYDSESGPREGACPG